MARNVVEVNPNRGLSVVSARTQMRAGEAYLADNLYFMPVGAKRRSGKRAAYQSASTGNLAVTLLKRFYKLATTGAVSKYLVKALGTTMWQNTTDYSDDTRTLLLAATWASVPHPSTTNNSLYGNYGGAPSTASFSTGNMNHAVATKSWLYMHPDYAAADDTSKITNVPYRLNGGGKAFLHGLVPPAQLDLADTEDDDVTSSISWASPLRVAPGPASSVMVKDPTRDDKYWIAYKDLSTNNLVVVTIIDGALGTPQTVTGPQTPLSGTGEQVIAMCVDYEGKPSVAWLTAAGSVATFSYRQRDAVTWTTETIAVGARASIDAVIDATNTVRAVVNNGVGLDPSYFTKTGSATTAAWSVAELIGGVGGSARGISIAVTSANIPLVAYQVVAGANLSVYYATRATGAWVVTQVDTNGGAGTCGHSPWIVITNDDVPYIAYSKGTDLKFADFSTGAWVLSVADAAGAVTDTPGGRHHMSLGSVAQADLAAAINPVYSNDQFPVIVGVNRMSSRQGTTPTWSAGAVPQTGPSFALQSVVVSGDTFFVVSQGSSIADMISGATSVYYYRLTAEYDDGVLGESRPSQATRVNIPWAIGDSGNHLLELGNPSSANRYDMTDDVTRINIYRTVRYGTADGTYYRAGFQACTLGAPTADFVDNVSDADLVLNRILDIDVFLPPKYRTAAVWKDRLVIGNTKCRNTSAVAGDQDSLDLGDSTAASIHKNRLRFSEAFAPDQFRQNFFQDILPDGDSGSIMRVIVNPSIDALMVFMENDVVTITDPIGDRVTSLSFRPKNIANSHGTPSPDSVVEHEGMIFYWTKWGVEVIAGYGARNISQDTIGVLWNALDVNHPRYGDRINPAIFSKVEGTVIVDNNGERIVWSYASATAAINNKELVLHYSRWKERGFQGDGVWSLNSGRSISRYCRWNGEGDRGQVFGGEGTGSRSAFVYRMDFDDEEQTGVNTPGLTTAAIDPFKLFTSFQYGGTRERLKRWITTRIDGKIATKTNAGTCAVAIGVNVDDGSLNASLDTVTWAQGSMEHVSKNLPRTAIGMTCGLNITATDTLSGSSLGPSPFELYNASMTLDDLPARTVRG